MHLRDLYVPSHLYTSAAKCHHSYISSTVTYWLFSGLGVTSSTTISWFMVHFRLSHQKVFKVQSIQKQFIFATFCVVLAGDSLNVTTNILADAFYSKSPLVSYVIRLQHCPIQSESNCMKKFISLHCWICCINVYILLYLWVRKSLKLFFKKGACTGIFCLDSRKDIRGVPFFLHYYSRLR